MPAKAMLFKEEGCAAQLKGGKKHLGTGTNQSFPKGLPPPM